MTLKRCPLALVTVLGLPLLAIAQTAAPPVDRNTAVPPPGKVDREMHEDIAVFRVLLNRSLTRYYGLPAAADRVHQIPQVEGVYLNGHGVVFSVSVPPAADPLGKPQAAAKPVSDWDRVQLELRGEKPPEEGKKAAAKKHPLADVLLDLLVENGRHFKSLAAAERLTVALTFRSSQDCIRCHTATGDYATYQRNMMGYGATPMFQGKNHSAEWARTSLQPPGQFGPRSTPSAPEMSNDQLTADLLFKQGKYAEAEQSYLRAIQKLEQVKNADEKPQAKLRRYFQLAEMASKLGQCAAALGQGDRAKQLLDLSKKFTDAAGKLADEQKSGASSTLPTQLVISATKQQLINQGSPDKVSAEAFRKIASIDLRVPEAKPEK